MKAGQNENDRTIRRARNRRNDEHHPDQPLAEMGSGDDVGGTGLGVHTSKGMTVLYIHQRG
jgi:hypothetical protein